MAHSNAADRYLVVRQDRVRLFEHLADPATTAEFFARVADDVNWTVEGTHPLGGTYTSQSDCWVCRFTGSEVGDEIVEVRAYLDSAMVAWTVERNKQG